MTRNLNMTIRIVLLAMVPHKEETCIYIKN